MRFLVWVLGIASFLWGGYWFVGARAVESGVQTALDDAVQSGHDITYSALNTRGFPNRFDTTVENIDVTSATGLRWQAPFFQLFALSYKPNHLIAIWPHKQQLSFAGVDLNISSDDMRASLQLEANTSLALDRFTVTMQAPEFALNTGETLSAKDLLIATRQAGSPSQHDLAITVNNLWFSAHGSDIAVRTVSLDTVLTFERPLNRMAQEPRLLALGLRKLSVETDDSTLSLTGDLTIDSGGYANGALFLTARNWREIFTLLQRIGAIPAQDTAAFEGAFQGLAAANAPASDFTAPLTVRRGQIKLGFLPIGTIPRL
jgi:hypothetical protein